MQKLILTIITATVLITNITGCSAQKSSTDVSVQSEQQNSTNSQESEQIPQTSLQIYDQTGNGIPVKAKYPNSIEVSSGGSGEGVGVFFTFKPQGNALDQAEIHLFLPAGAKTAAEVETYVIGVNGLMANNGWIVDKAAAAPQDLMYSWVKKIITFSTDQEMMGHLLIGETNGQGLQVILLYPKQMANAYWPAAKTVLGSLEFEPNLLPIKRSEL
jgi:hypothetical protein